MPRADEQRTLQTAFALHQQGRLHEAAPLYRALIAGNPKNAHALHLLGLVEASGGQLDKAKRLLARAVAVNPADVQLLENYATILFQLRDYRSALEISEKGLQHNAANASLLYVSAVALFKLDQFERALAQFDKVLARQPNNIAAINERGAVLAKLRRHPEALACFDSALQLDPSCAPAQFNKAALAAEQDHHEQAIQAYDRALALEPGLAEAWLGKANVHRRQQRPVDAFAALDKALALDARLAEAWSLRGTLLWEAARYDEALTACEQALALEPNLAGAWVGRGNVCYALGRFSEALAAYDKALAIEPGLAAAWLGRGNALARLKRSEGAASAYDKVLAIDPGLAKGWAGRGDLFLDRRDFAQALAAYDQAMALQADLAGVEGLRLHCKMHLCDWTNFDAACAHLTASIRANEPVSPPFTLLAIPSTAEEQLQSARSWSAHQYPAAAQPIWAGERYRHERIRVAYLSGDFREHAISRLVAGLYESHDRMRFEILALSSGPSDGSDIRRRIEAAFDRFVDVTSYSEDQLAEFIRASEIDLLVDVAGYTAWARTRALARRPAPVQINYLGYPGTMGAPYVDYIVADAIIIPEEHKPFYSEKVVYLPHTYQPNDSKRVVPQRSFERTELGLPADSVVLCCFNNCYKITPPVFVSWMQILKGAANSVLWLFEENAIAPNNLKREAAARGIDPQRLIFAARMPHDDHMARLRHADLFLDTAPYNAHTTASDALWMGLPLVTRIGDTFAGRVAASLLTAMGVPELVTSSVEAYEALAIELAGNPERRAAIKRKLAANRQTAPLFDTTRYTRHVEAAYVAMYERWQAGLPPADIVVQV